MKKLEHLAQQIFTHYVYKKTGTWLDWRYLSKERKLEWLKELEMVFQECLNNIQQDIKPYLQVTPGTTSYEKGFLAGQTFEARRIDGKINNIKADLEKQLEEFKSRHED